MLSFLYQQVTSKCWIFLFSLLTLSDKLKQVEHASRKTKTDVIFSVENVAKKLFLTGRLFGFKEYILHNFLISSSADTHFLILFSLVTLTCSDFLIMSRSL